MIRNKCWWAQAHVRYVISEAWAWHQDRPPREAFAHNVLAHPLLWAWPRLGRWIHQKTDP